MLDGGGFAVFGALCRQVHFPRCPAQFPGLPCCFGSFQVQPGLDSFLVPAAAILLQSHPPPVEVAEVTEHRDAHCIVFGWGLCLKHDGGEYVAYYVFQDAWVHVGQTQGGGRGLRRFSSLYPEQTFGVSSPFCAAVRWLLVGPLIHGLDWTCCAKLAELSCCFYAFVAGC